MKLRLIVIFGFLLSFLITWSQTKYHDLKGSWIVNNAGNQYDKNDTLRFLNTSERLYCDNVVWNINKPSDFHWSKCNCCNEPPRITVLTKKQRLMLENEVLCFFLGTELLERFKILDLTYLDFESKTGSTSSRIKQLTLLRIK